MKKVIFVQLLIAFLNAEAGEAPRSPQGSPRVRASSNATVPTRIVIANTRVLQQVSSSPRGRNTIEHLKRKVSLDVLDPDLVPPHRQ